MDKLEEMKIFAAVVRNGSFSAAGSELNLTPSAISKKISTLEQRLSTRLLHRTTRRLNLTEAGRVFLERCQAILSDVAEAESMLAEISHQPFGRLRVSGTVGFTRMQVMPLVPAFLEAYPEVQLELSLSDATVDLVEEGIDLAIRLGRLPDSSLVARSLGESKRVICATPQYLAHHGTPKKPQDLAAHNCLTLTAASDHNEWRFHTRQGIQRIRVSGNFSTSASDALYQALLGGTGIARLSTFMVGPDIQAGRLVPLLEKQNREVQLIHAVYPHRRHLPPKVACFVNFLAEHFDTTSWD